MSVDYYFVWRLMLYLRSGQVATIRQLAERAQTWSFTYTSIYIGVLYR